VIGEKVDGEERPVEHGLADRPDVVAGFSA
jgi:hypothetical protein